jgi:hypothetical protein
MNLRRLIEWAVPKHDHFWNYTRDRDPGSMVLFEERRCACGLHQERIKTIYGSGRWYEVEPEGKL